jgi:hypothetical protein
MYVADSTGTALSVSSAAKLVTNSCNVTVNSTDSKAIEVKNNGSQINAGSGSIAVRGGTSTSAAGQILGTVTTGAARSINPLAYLQMPAVPSGCTYTNKTVTTTESLSPGTYCGGLTVQNATGRANLAPGNYFMVGGGLTVQSSGTISGTGVTIINTFAAGYSYRGFNLQSSGIINLSAPTSGDLAGILLFEDPASAPANAVNDIHSGSGSTIVGSFYLPAHKTIFGSASSTTITGGIVAKQLEIKNNNTVVTFTGNTTGSTYPFKRVSLIE